MPLVQNLRTAFGQIVTTIMPEASVKKPKSVVFTIDTNDSDKYKGANYDEKIICYSFKNDDWHLYRAIPLTETLVKIEVWHRDIAVGDFIYGYDICVINLNDTETDFEWTDDEHTSFTITMQDQANDHNWQEPTLVSFVMENENYSFTDVKSYLEGITVEKDEVASNEEETVEAPEPVEEVTAETEEDKELQEEVNEQAEEISEEAKKSETVSYSTNDKSTVKNGNSGVYSYKSMGGTYDNYYIIDFDEGYVYFFSEGNGSGTCDRVKIESGNLNDVLIITYHDGDDVWSYGLHFKYKHQPDHLILQDIDGFESDFYTTDLDNALRIKNGKTVHDY